MRIKNPWINRRMIYAVILNLNRYPRFIQLKIILTTSQAYLLLSIIPDLTTTPGGSSSLTMVS